MFYEDFQLNVLRMLRLMWSRLVSFDFETYRRGDFLTDERILAISFARRVGGNFLESRGIEVKTLFLEEDTNDSEIELLKEFGGKLGKIKPLCVLGYGIMQYDVPLIAIKKQRYWERMKEYGEFWKLVDFAESAVHVDLYHLLKYKGYRKFEDAVGSNEFGGLPLKKVKRIVTADRKEKPLEIYNLWKENKERLKSYVEGEVHDVLLIAEKLVQ